MKSFPIIILAALLLASCGGKKQEEAVKTDHVRDSLQMVIDQRERELDDLMSTFNDIEEGFRLIDAAEGRVNVAKDSEGEDKAARIKQNIGLIQQQMTHNRELINKLRQQLRESSINSEHMKATLERFTALLDAKSKEVDELRAELAEKDVEIDVLDTKIKDLNNDMDQLAEQNQQKQQTIMTQDKTLNTAWFVFGTKNELKDQRIIADGQVLRSNFNKDYFTKIDIRIDKEIKLYSKSAKILTNHPASSYTLTPDNNKQYVLRITNPQQFWSTSKYLVILVK